MKGSHLETHLQVVGFHLNRLDEPVFIAVSKPLLTDLEFIIDWRVVGHHQISKVQDWQKGIREGRLSVNQDIGI